jgi:dienelactone hydrolase
MTGSQLKLAKALFLLRKNNMNKANIIIIGIVLVAIIIGAWYLQKSEIFLSECGNGICDEREQADPNLCQRDCQIENYTNLKDNLILEKQEVREDVEIYHYTLSNGETMMNGYIMKPEGDGPFPAVVVNHGGGGSARSFGIPNGMIFAKRGYVAIACDYTHKDWFTKMKEEGWEEGWGPGASEENIARALKNIEILKSLDYVDDNKIAILGNSMGGFLTVGVAQRTNDLKAAIVVVAGIKDGNPQTPADEIIEIISPPENLVKEISCPMLILAAKDDRTVDLKYPRHLKELLDEYNKTAKLIIYSNVGHDLIRVRRDEVYKDIFSFLGKYMD